MQTVEFNNVEIKEMKKNTHHSSNKAVPRKWREIEDLKAKMLLAKELQEIDPSFDLPKWP